MIAQFAPGVLFLGLASSAVALVVALLVSTPTRAILLAAGVSTVLLNGWAYNQLGSFDFTFLTLVAVVAVASAFVVVRIVASIRRRFLAVAR